MYGHHPDLLAERLAVGSTGREMLSKLNPRVVARDPELSDALFALRSRIKQIELRKLRSKGKADGL